MDIIEEGARFNDWLFRKFDPKSNIFLRWLNSFEYAIELSQTKDDEKVKYLLDMMEPSVLKQIKEKLHPSNPIDLPYDEIITVLVKTFSNVKKSEVYNYRYLLRKQLPYESIEHYVLALRELYSKCTPYTKSSVNITNRFVEGLMDEETKKCLKCDKNIKFSIAVAIAKQAELAEQIKNLGIPSSP